MKSIGHSNLRYIKANKEDKVEIIMPHTIMAEGTIKIGTDQTVRIGEFDLAGKVEVDKGMNKIIGEEFLDAIQGHIKILEDRIAEENMELIIGMKITAEREVGVGLEKGHFQEIIVIIIEGMIEV